MVVEQCNLTVVQHYGQTDAPNEFPAEAEKPHQGFTVACPST
jgi:hypothetical protein